MCAKRPASHCNLPPEHILITTSEKSEIEGRGVRRLAERGYTAQKKLNKESYSEAQVTAHARPDDDGLGYVAICRLGGVADGSDDDGDAGEEALDFRAGPSGQDSSRLEV